MGALHQTASRRRRPTTRASPSSWCTLSRRGSDAKGAEPSEETGKKKPGQREVAEEDTGEPARLLTAALRDACPEDDDETQCYSALEGDDELTAGLAGLQPGSGSGTYTDPLLDESSFNPPAGWSSEASREGWGVESHASWGDSALNHGAAVDIGKAFEAFHGVGNSGVFGGMLGGGDSDGGADSEKNWWKNFEVDVLSTVRGCEVLLPHMKESGGGAVTFITTTASVETFGGPQAYNAMKGSLLVYAKQLLHLL